jgi:EAL domain-containing protein (putative c-di-GMP-specific phosphodiesterase class I)
MPDPTLIDAILEPRALSVAFQPVYEVQGAGLRVHYLEALVRGPRGTAVEAADILFEYARRKNRAADLDRACLHAVLAEARSLPDATRLGLNIHASTLAMDPEFLNVLGDALSLHGIHPSRLIVEIVEHAPPWDVDGFRNGLAGLRDIGAQIALDDIGLGHSNYLMILECRPDYFKIDRHFVRGARHDFYRQAVLSSVAQLARPFGAQVVAEGIEDDGDLTAVRQSGIALAQGFLLSEAHPVSHFAGNGRRPRRAE